MFRTWLMIAGVSLSTLGCGGGAYVDSAPTILGLTPELRAEMRKVVRESDPRADVDKVVGDYMARLKKIASLFGIEPDADGNLQFSPEMQVQLVEDDTGQCRVAAFVKESEIELPSWADPLLKECKTGIISQKRKELLKTVVVAELISSLAG